MTNPYKFAYFPPDHWLMVVCLNLVPLRGLSVDEAIEKMTDLGITPELRYQWNEARSEIDVLAIVQCDPLNLDGEPSLSDETIRQLWEIFGKESMWSTSTGRTGDLSKTLIRAKLERPRPSAPPKPDWYVEPVREVRQVSV